MKSVRQLITEKSKRSDYGRKGGQGGTRSTSSTPFQRGEDKAKVDNPQKYQTPRKKLGGPTRILRSPEGPTITNMPEPSRGTTDEVIARVSKKQSKGFGNLPITGETGSGGKTASSSKPRGDTAKSGDVQSFVRGEQGKGRPVSGTLQDTSARKDAGYDFPKDAGTEKRKPTKPGSYVVDTEPKKGKPTGSLSKGNLKFSGDAKYKEMLAKLPNAEPKKPRTVKQAEVSKEIAQKTAEYKTERGEAAYKKTAADIEARRAFPTGKGGLKADETNPYVKREVRQARAAKLGGNVWDQPKGSSEPFKGQGKTPSKTTYPSFFKPTKPRVSASRIAKTTAPDRPATRQAVQFLKSLKRKSSSTTVSTPNKATTHGVGPDGQYLSPEMRKAAHKNRNVTAVVPYKEPKKKRRTSPAELARREQSQQTRALQKSQKQLGQQFARAVDKSTRQTTAAMKQSSAQMSKAMGDMQKTQARKLQGASAALSLLGATQEYKAGAERARRQGYGKLGQIAQGGLRAAGAAAGGTIGGVVGGRVGGGVGAALGGGYLYSQGAKAGTKVFDTVAKSSQGRWLAKQAKKLVPGLA